MSTELMIYSITFLDKFLEMVEIVIVIGVIGGCVGSVVYTLLKATTDDYDTGEKKVIEMIDLNFKKFLTIFIVAVLFYVFIPNSKTVSAMYLIPKITDNEQIQEMPEKLLKVMNGHLDKWILDLSETKKDSE